MSKKTRQKFSSVIRNNAFILGKVAKFTPGYFVWMIIEGITMGILNTAVSLFTYRLLNAVGDGSQFSEVLKIIAVMVVYNLLMYAFDKWYWIIQSPLLKQKLHIKMHAELFEKSQSLDLSCFDDPEFYNDFVWAMNESDKRATQVISDTSGLINRLVASSSLFGLLFTIDPIVALILFLSSSISIVCRLIGNKVGFNHSKEANTLWRKRNYINRVYHLSDYAKELRISKADEILMAEYNQNENKMVDLDVKYGKKYYLIYGLCSNLVSTGTFFAILFYMAYLLGEGAVAVGGFAATINVIWKIRWMFSDLIQKITNFPQHSLYIEKYREFLKYVPKIGGGIKDIPEFESLEFKNVSFSYEFDSNPKYKFHDHEIDYTAPTKDEKGKNALKNVSFTLKKGEKIAIVGYNGAGKTTLIKLMMRLYDPTEGEILYNGVNVKQYDPECYRKMIGTVFQDFKLFATSVAQNVINGKYEEEIHRDTVLDALDKADFTEKLKTLKNGIDTHLTREFDDEGTNLSGGESQKVVIARVFAGKYPIVIMDEPSSALDPMAEYNLNQSILKSTNDKTVVFISHRLSTTRIADKIYMFAKGQLIEEGSHKELLERDGKYAEMFRLQSEKYEDGATA